MYWYDHRMNGWGYLFMALGTLGFWALVIVAAVALLRHRPPASVTRLPSASAEQVLAERFARGELDDDEFYRRLSVLQHGAWPDGKAR